MEKTKRILSIFLVVLMLFTSLPMNAFAEEVISLSEESTTAEMTTDVEDISVTEETIEETTVTEEAPVAETEYLIGKDYIIDGIKYQINQNGTVYVVDETEDMPERVVILSHLGEYPVTQISYTAFGNQKKLKEIVIPETVKVLEGLSNTGLEKVEIKADYVDIDRFVFSSSPFISDEKNWTGDNLIVGS